ncbi:MAG: ParB/RepB/Spo0J family partition protein [Defluviitaleaceae bacterium]|nr:ParB/RepB/Spo0J family partition protein [Defluviitaleaceae bacterium]
MNTAVSLNYLQDMSEDKIYNLPVEMVLPNPFQPRRHFEPIALVDLATSIKQHGLMQPISVRIVSDGYELIAGERRLRATKLAGISTISAIIVDITDAESAILAMVENLQRQNLNYIEEAEGFYFLISKHSLTQDDLARKLGKNQSTIANKLRLLKLPSRAKKALIENSLSERHARALLVIMKDRSLPQAEQLMMEIIERIVQSEMTVQKTEEYINKILNFQKKMAARRNIKAHIRDIRIFTNTIKQAVDVMQDSGVNATYDVEEKQDGCVITVLVTY